MIVTRQLTQAYAPKIVAKGLAALILAALLPIAQAQQAVTVQADGSVAVALENERFVVLGSVAEAVEAAVRENADDPEALRLAIRAIVAEYAGEPGDAGLATALAALAVLHAGSNSSSIAAIALGATQGNSAVSGGSLIAVVPALREASPGESAERELARAQATVENPAQISPVQ